MKKIIIGIIFFLLLAGGLTLGGFFYVRHLKNIPVATEPEMEIDLSQEEITALTKPAVVRIVHHTQGKAQLPVFSIDFKKFEIIPDEAKKTIEVPFDEYFSGSGFIINPDGFIATNSHVVSNKTIRLTLAALHAKDIITTEISLAAISGNYAENNNDAQVEEKATALGKNIIAFILENSQFEIEKKVAVLNPQSTQEKLPDLFAAGFAAAVVSVNDDFEKDSKDVALLKIDEVNLPTLKISQDSKPTTGNKITVAGFPASAEFNEKNILEPTFTSGTINAFKDSDNKDFKVFQTDAKISQGSSGGPTLNSAGEVIGITTFQSGDLQRQSGDNFSFAIPANLLSDLLTNFKVNATIDLPASINSTEYSDHFLRGLRLSRNHHCQKAITEFKLAQQSNSNFSTSKFVLPHMENCQNIIAAGKSIDTRWDIERMRLEKIPAGTWVIIGAGVLFLILAIIFIAYLAGKVKKDEQEMAHMEEELEHLQHPHEENPKI